MFGWLFTAVTVGTKTFSLLRIALLGFALLAGTNLINTGVTGWLSYNAGWRNADNAHQAAVGVESVKHSTWLVDTARAAGLMTEAAEISPEDLQRMIRNAIAKPGDGAVCLGATFLRDLQAAGELRERPAPTAAATVTRRQ
jgi:hypothetical protein